MLTVRVEQGGIKPHLEWRQRVIGRLLFNVNPGSFRDRPSRRKGMVQRLRYVSREGAGKTLSAYVRRSLEVLSKDTYKSKFRREDASLLIDIQGVSQIQMSGRR